MAQTDVKTVEQSWVVHHWPPRQAQTHKAQQGHAWLVAGSCRFWGAGVLASSGAYRMGCGYVHWASFQNPQEVLKEIPEVLFHKVEDLYSSSTVSAVAVGPGLEVNSQTAHLIETLKTKPWPVVLDASAIKACTDFHLFPLPEHWLLTPHEGELAYVLKTPPQTIQKDRLAYAKKGAQKAGCCVLLKGLHTLIVQKNEAWEIPTGNSALAKAGTGDVLTGMILGLMAQGVPPWKAGAMASYVHGKVADLWVEKYSEESFSASDFQTQLPQALKEVLHS